MWTSTCTGVGDDFNDTLPGSERWPDMVSYTTWTSVCTGAGHGFNDRLLGSERQPDMASYTMWTSVDETLGKTMRALTPDWAKPKSGKGQSEGSEL